MVHIKNLPLETAVWFKNNLEQMFFGWSYKHMMKFVTFHEKHGFQGHGLSGNSAIGSLPQGEKWLVWKNLKIDNAILGWPFM